VLFPSVAAGVIKLFDSLLSRLRHPARFDAEPVEREARRGQRFGALSRVPDFGAPRVLTELVSLVEATTRSNWALGGPWCLKFASASVPFLPRRSRPQKSRMGSVVQA